ncbi:MAG TPA: M23 family metallopeptidase [Jiangellaceae bacterium]
MAKDHLAELADALVVDFPLRGEWYAVRSPGSRIPSHGTDVLAQRYAFDLQRLGHRRRPHPAGWVRILVAGVPVRECFGWGEPVHSVLDGVVVAAVDGVPERTWLHPARELWHAGTAGVKFQPTAAGVRRLVGNHVIVRSDAVYAAYAHLVPGSVQVDVGQHVRRGDVVGRVGSSGNSTAPHLHFQLMDNADPLVARALPAVFAGYDVWRHGRWQRAQNSVPTTTERIRVTKSEADDSSDKESPS